MPGSLLVQGALHFAAPARLSGWCTLPEQPAWRATIDIVVNGTLVASMVAAQRSDGGDGRNGFSLDLRTVPPASITTVIEAREQGSALVFGRIVLFPEHLAAPIEHRLGALDTSVLRAPIKSAAAARVGISEAMGALGRDLARHGQPDCTTERNRLAHLMPRLRLSEQPALSLILPAAPNADQTLHWLACLQPVCDSIDAELLLADDGADPASVLLPQLMRQLRYLRCRPGLPTQDLNLLVAEARGVNICFIEPPARQGAWYWPQFGPTAPARIQLGGVAAAQMARCGARRGYSVQRCAPHGVALHMQRAHWRDAGGFDPALCGTVAYADLGEKIGMLGMPVTLLVSDDVETPVGEARKNVLF